MYCLFDFYADDPPTVGVGLADSVMLNDDEDNIEDFADGKTQFKVKWKKGNKKAQMVPACILKISDDFAKLVKLSKQIEDCEIGITDVISLDINGDTDELKRVSKQNPKYAGAGDPQEVKKKLRKAKGKKKKENDMEDETTSYLKDILAENSVANEQPAVVELCKPPTTDKEIKLLRREVASLKVDVFGKFDEIKALLENLIASGGLEKTSDETSGTADGLRKMPNGVTIPLETLDGANKSTLRKYVADVMLGLFTRKEMRSHSLTGRASNAIAGSVAKPQINRRKLAALKDLVWEVYPHANDTEINAAITYKLNTESKVQTIKKDVEEHANQNVEFPLLANGQEQPANGQDSIEI